MDKFDAVKNEIKDAAKFFKQINGKNYRENICSFSLSICYLGNNDYSAEACFDENYNMVIMTDDNDDIQKLLSLDEETIVRMIDCYDEESIENYKKIKLDELLNSDFNNSSIFLGNVNSVMIEAYHSHKNLNKNNKNFNSTILVLSDFDSGNIGEYVTISKNDYESLQDDPYNSLIKYGEAMNCFENHPH